MTFDRANLERRGFRGFMSFRTLETASMAAPDLPAAYVVLQEPPGPPAFLERSVGGRFKGRDPTVRVDLLTSRWMDDCALLYIGKADRLRRRLAQRVAFGRGKPVGAWGGRLIWQIDGAIDFVVAWLPCKPDEMASVLEAQLLSEFVQAYGRLPFANLRG